jgi:plastocyanin
MMPNDAPPARAPRWRDVRGVRWFEPAAMALLLAAVAAPAEGAARSVGRPPHRVMETAPDASAPDASAHVASARVETGRIEGVAILSKRLAKSRLRMRVYDEPGAAAPPTSELPPMRNVVMYLKSTAALRAVRAPAVGVAPVIHQREERFDPHVLPIQVGASVQFPNDDPIFHNVFSLSRAATFDLGRFPAGVSKSVAFTSPGVATVFCHIHADMSAFVVVLDHPFFVVPELDGTFVLDGVPDGDYELMAWHERVRPFSTRIRVEAGKTVRVRVLVPLPDSDP